MHLGSRQPTCGDHLAVVGGRGQHGVGELWGGDEHVPLLRGVLDGGVGQLPRLADEALADVEAVNPRRAPAGVLDGCVGLSGSVRRRYLRALGRWRCTRMSWDVAMTRSEEARVY